MNALKYYLQTLIILIVMETELAVRVNISVPDFKLGFGKNVWNNSESDPAILYDSQGKK